MRCAGFSPICQVHFAGFQILPRTAARGACLRLIARCRKRAIKNLRLQLHVSQKRAVAKMRLSQHPWWRSTMAHRDRGTLHVVPSLVAALGGAVLPVLPAATRVPALRHPCNNPVAMLEQMAAHSAQLARGSAASEKPMRWRGILHTSARVKQVQLVTRPTIPTRLSHSGWRGCIIHCTELCATVSTVANPAPRSCFSAAPRIQWRGIYPTSPPCPVTVAS